MFFSRSLKRENSLSTEFCACATAEKPLTKSLEVISEKLGKYSRILKVSANKLCDLNCTH